MKSADSQIIGTADPFGDALEINRDGNTTAPAFFDMNGDGLPDLVIGTGAAPTG